MEIRRLTRGTPTIQTLFSAEVQQHGAATHEAAYSASTGVFDVTEGQARSALLPDAVISEILDQFTFEIEVQSNDLPSGYGPRRGSLVFITEQPIQKCSGKSAQAKVQLA
ncbi:hypothetical protein KIN20_031066 [Parelaphostrongylus tenuis]|uniref:Uncharacterized protein n=1 Tax=Parelaphostrongylus tenuis TaxID=148309 RepID=A0AAD5WGR5_PARTN|nr:hypothetical protein KIN20_031066 [Parelaphostrongylus tenuis]